MMKTPKDIELSFWKWVLLHSINKWSAKFFCWKKKSANHYWIKTGGPRSENGRRWYSLIKKYCETFFKGVSWGENSSKCGCENVKLWLSWNFWNSQSKSTWWKCVEVSPLQTLCSWCSKMCATFIEAGNSRVATKNSERILKTICDFCSVN